MGQAEAFQLGFWDVDDATYFADSPHSLSHSESEDFAENPALYEGRHLLKRWAEERTAPLEFGVAFDATVFTAVLSPGSIVQIPPDVLTTNGQRRGKAWDEWSSAQGSKILVTQRQAAVIAAMLDSLHAHESANRLLFELEGRAQQAIRFECPHTGIVRRSKLDRLLLKDGYIVDLKTAADSSPKAFAKQAIDLGYHRQAQWYQEAVWMTVGEKLPFVFVVVQKTPPYTVNCIDLDEEFLELAAEENEATLRRFAECQRTGVWRHESHGSVITISPPGWAKQERYWSL